MPIGRRVATAAGVGDQRAERISALPRQVVLGNTVKSRRAAGGRLRAQLLAERGSVGQVQISAELVPIPDASRMRPDASGCVRMRRDFGFQQISANSSKIPANLDRI